MIVDALVVQLYAHVPYLVLFGFWIFANCICKHFNLHFNSSMSFNCAWPCCDAGDNVSVLKRNYAILWRLSQLLPFAFLPLTLLYVAYLYLDFAYIYLVDLAFGQSCAICWINRNGMTGKVLLQLAKDDKLFDCLKKEFQKRIKFLASGLFLNLHWNLSMTIIN